VVKRRLRDTGQPESRLTSAQLLRYQALAAKYPLADWYAVCTWQESLVDLHTLDLLDRNNAPVTARPLMSARRLST
jgi:hypothetical protein